MREPFSLGEFDPGAFTPAARQAGLVVSAVLVAVLVFGAFFTTASAV